MNTIFALFLRGGAIMWPLLLCSILSATVSIERLAFWRERTRSRRSTEPEVLRAQSLVRAGAREEALAVLATVEDPAAELLSAGLAGNDASAAMGRCAVPLMRACRRGLRVLDTIITVAPMLGLLGTVAGVISSFGFVGGTDRAGQINVTGIGGGIAEALITTAFGLIIAIATIVPYNYFTSRVQREAEELTAIATSMEEALRDEDRIRS